MHPEGDFIGILSAPVEFAPDAKTIGRDGNPITESGLEWRVIGTHLRNGSKKTLLTPSKIEELTGVEGAEKIDIIKITGQYYGSAKAGLTLFLNGLLGARATAFVDAERDYDELDQAQVTYSVKHETTPAGTKKAVMTSCSATDEWLDTLDED